MLDKPGPAEKKSEVSSPPLDFQEHLARLEAAGLLLRVDRAINKDTELHPLVRWQFQADCTKTSGAPFSSLMS